MGQINSYPKVYNLGHPAIKELLFDPVTIQEKVDGSQFSWLKDEQGTVHFRSKGAVIYPETTDKLFKPAVDHVLSVADELEVGTVYRGEVLAKPKHNTVQYSRVPIGNIVLFDMNRDEEYVPCDWDNLTQTADRLGIEPVETYAIEVPDTLTNMESLDRWLDMDSQLGGAKIEGVVIKNYHRWGRDGKPLFGKYVSEAFKEQHSKEWKKTNPNRGDVIDQVLAGFNKEAIWQKAKQHLAEKGALANEPRDIGALIKEAQADAWEEAEEQLVAALVRWAKPQVLRALTRGLPEWYKKQLAIDQFLASDPWTSTA